MRRSCQGLGKFSRVPQAFLHFFGTFLCALHDGPGSDAVLPHFPRGGGFCSFDFEARGTPALTHGPVVRRRPSPEEFCNSGSRSALLAPLSHPSSLRTLAGRSADFADVKSEPISRFLTPQLSLPYE